MGVNQERQKEQYDAIVHGKPYADGDLVWLFNPGLPRYHSRKFRRPWIGPYWILEKLSEANYRIQHMSNGKRAVIHFDWLKPCPAGVRLPTRRSQQCEKEQQPQGHRCWGSRWTFWTSQSTSTTNCKTLSSTSATAT